MNRPSDTNLAEEAVTPLHPSTDIGAFALKVAELDRSLAFYTRVIGLERFSQEGRRATLGSRRRVILHLEEVPGARPQPEGATGLYHAAILFPDRRSLAIKILQLSAADIPFGYADHLVSEAFYLSDPDGNGLELYRDRPRSEWTWANNRVRMVNAPIDFDDFFSGLDSEQAALEGPAAPDGTKLGHMHLRVSDTALAEKFYHGVMGFDVTARMPGALFLSAGGYHHHLGANTWQSRGGRPPAEPSAGLREFSIALPDEAELDRLARQVEQAGTPVERNGSSAGFLDPFQNRVILVVKNHLILD